MILGSNTGLLMMLGPAKETTTYVLVMSIALMGCLAWIAWLNRQHVLQTQEMTLSARVQATRRFVRHRALTMTFGLGIAVVASLVALIRGPVLLGFFAIAVMVWAGRSWIEDAFAGLILSAMRVFRIGDSIETAGHVGVVDSMGLTQLRIRSRDGSLRYLRYRAIVTGGVTNASRARSDVAIEVSLPLHPGDSPAQAREYAALCAATSPFASLHKRPETFLTAPVPGARDACVVVRGYVFDTAHSELYRSHIVEAWLERRGRL